MRLFVKVVETATWKTAQIGQVALAAAMFLLVSNILLRMLWGQPIPGTVELTEMLGAVLLAMGVAYCQMTKGHVFVEVLIEKLPTRLQAVIEAIMSLVALFFTGLLAQETVVFGIDMAKRGYKTADLLIPVYPFIYLVAFGFLMLAVVLLRDLIKAVIRVVKGCEAQ